MNGRPAVIFPDTVPSEQILIPFVQVFGPLVYFQAVENDQVPSDLHSALCDEMVRESLCRFEVPAPLGKDRDRFLHLVSDLQNRSDDYAAQLSHVTLAGISSASRPEAESKSSILSNLLSSKGIQEDSADKRTMLLWQARLVLKLGEIYDAEQERLKRELRKISEKEGNLLDELRREADTSFLLTRKLSTVSSGNEGMQKLRRKAWARIYALGSVRSDEIRIFLSRDNDAVDRLLEQYERITGTPSVRLIRCKLPADYPEKENLLQQIRQFKREGTAVLEKLYAMVDNLTGTDRPDIDLWTGEDGPWEKLLAQFFPEDECGRVQLSLYTCPQISPERLFIESFAYDKDEILRPSLSASGPGLILGVLQELKRNI